MGFIIVIWTKYERNDQMTDLNWALNCLHALYFNELINRACKLIIKQFDRWPCSKKFLSPSDIIDETLLSFCSNTVVYHKSGFTDKEPLIILQIELSLIMIQLFNLSTRYSLWVTYKGLHIILSIWNDDQTSSSAY